MRPRPEISSFVTDGFAIIIRVPILVRTVSFPTKVPFEPRTFQKKKNYNNAITLLVVVSPERQRKITQ